MLICIEIYTLHTLNFTIVLGSVAIHGNDLNTLSISSTLKNSNKQLIRTSGMFAYCLSNLNIGKSDKVGHS